MNIQLRTEKGKNLTSKNEVGIPENIKRRRLTDADHAYHGSGGDIFLLQELVIDGFTIGFHIFIADKTKTLRLDYKNPCAVLQYMLDGNNCTLLSDGNGTTLTSNSFFHLSRRPWATNLVAAEQGMAAVLPDPVPPFPA